MGCLNSKKSSSTTTVRSRPSTSTRVHHIGNSNGIVRMPKLNLEQDDARNNQTDNDVVDGMHIRQLRMKPPPPAPTPSPPSLVTTPRPLETEPPTPESDRPPLHIQYAEDLRPISPVASEIAEATREDNHNPPTVSTEPTLDAIHKAYTQSKAEDNNKSLRVSVSNVTLNPNVNGLSRAPLLLRDMSVEELDTGIDEFSKYRLVYNRPDRPKSESHLVRNRTFVIRHGFEGLKVDRPRSEYIPKLTEPSM